MNLSKVHSVYFVGIGGIGMSALARYFIANGKVVAGYDKTPSEITDSLVALGAEVHFEDAVKNIPEAFLNPENTLVIYTPAIPKNHIEFNYFKNNKYHILKRSQILGLITENTFCLAVAGTHGKTTTTSILGHLLHECNVPLTAFLGGISENYNSNLILNGTEVSVVEADEFDRSFLTLSPNFAGITSMDADHLDIYGDESHLHESFYLFADQLKENGKLFVKDGLPMNGIAYSANLNSALKATNIHVKDGNFVFDFEDGYTTIKELNLAMPGKHNVENAVAAIGVALSLGIHPKSLKKAVATFKGVKRRFETLVNTPEHIYIDDYAHHPEELRACFDAVRQLHPDKKLTVIFQPHLFTRTRDFADEFAKVLSTADELILLEIYPARELPIEGINSQMLLDKVTSAAKELCGKDSVLARIKSKKPELLLTVGAGDIDTLVEPLKITLNNA